MRQSLGIGLLLFFVSSFLIRTDYSLDQDLGRHLKLGEIIISSEKIPQINLFSYTFPDFPFINHHYLFETLIFLGQPFIGLEGFLVLKVVVILLAVGITLVLVKNYLPLILPLGFIFLHVLRERVELRPEIFSFLFTALTYFILERFEKQNNKVSFLLRNKLIFGLPFIQLIWVNTHIYFIIGIILQGIFLANLIFKKCFSQAKLLLIIIFASTLLTFINPNGIQGAFYPLRIFENYGYTIVENQSLFLLESLQFRDNNFLFVKISALIIILSLLLAALRRLPLKNFLLPLMGLTLALIHVRSLPYLVFISLPATIENFGLTKFNRLTVLLSFLVTFLLIGESLFYLNGQYYQLTDTDVQPQLKLRAHGKAALDFVLAQNLPQPIFNNFDIGSYIIYRGFPNIKVFVDGRPEAYPKEFFQQVYIPMQTDPQIFGEIDQKFAFQTIIFSHTDQTPWGKNFLKSIINNKQSFSVNETWQTVFLDDFMIILVKKEAAVQKGLKEVNLETLSPEQYTFDSHVSYLRLSLFLLNTDHPKVAELFAKKALELSPQSPLGNLIFANLIPQLGTKYYPRSKNRIFW